MKTLNKKLLRDLRLMWSQALTIALVVASGIAGFITTLSSVDSLQLARDQFYASGRFSDVFANVKRAPNSLEETLRQVAGVADVQTTLQQVVRIKISNSSDPILGQLIGIDLEKSPRMNLVSIRNGYHLNTGKQNNDGSHNGLIDALVSEGFANTRGIKPGMELSALINGKHRRIRIVGIALSPEFIFASLAGMPDIRGFGVFWIDTEVLAAAYGMDGAFNHVAIKLAPNASQAAVIDKVNQLIRPYGGREAYGRKDQVSHAMLDNEIKEQRVLGTVLPLIFLGVAAFLLNVVVSRVVTTQREQIAALKALGYSNLTIGLYYLKFVLVIVLFGLVLGTVMGKWLGKAFTGLYADFFHFPRFDHHIAPWLLIVGIGVTVITATLGTLNAIAGTVRLSPAEAMHPPAPGSYRRTLAERLGLTKLPTALRMILRNMERRPLRSLLSIAGVAAAVAIVVMGNFIRDATDVIMDSKFALEMRSNVIVSVTEPISNKARFELARLPGVIAVEPGRDISVRLVHGNHSHRTSIQGYVEKPELRRIIDIEAQQVLPQKSGLVMTDRLANKLHLKIGNQVIVQILEDRPRTLMLPVSATVKEMMGLNTYMEQHALNQLLGEDDLATQYAIALERGSEPEFLEAAMKLPRVVGVFSKKVLWRNMQDISARNIRIMSTMLTFFASIIAIGVVYNNARIALAERTWELASLRVLGFTRAEVSGLLLGEMAISIGIALPLGMLLGNVLVHFIVQLLSSDQFMFPVVIQPRTYAFAGLAVLSAGVASALVVRRRISHLDMISALKTRE
jgi:putative ABC transport system permease protein